MLDGSMVVGSIVVGSMVVGMDVGGMAYRLINNSDLKKKKTWIMILLNMFAYACNELHFIMFWVCFLLLSIYLIFSFG